MGLLVLLAMVPPSPAPPTPATNLIRHERSDYSIPVYEFCFDFRLVRWNGTLPLMMTLSNDSGRPFAVESFSADCGISLRAGNLVGRQLAPGVVEAIEAEIIVESQMAVASAEERRVECKLET